MHSWLPDRQNCSRRGAFRPTLRLALTGPSDEDQRLLLQQKDHCFRGILDVMFMDIDIRYQISDIRY